MQSLIQRVPGRCEGARAQGELRPGVAALKPFGVSRCGRVCPLQLNEVGAMPIKQGGNTSNFVPDGQWTVRGFFIKESGINENVRRFRALC